jgi:hypothetical protein
MFASLLTFGLLLALFLPGLALAYKRQSLNLTFLLKCTMLNFSLFALLGLLFRALPWLIDPRFKL